MHVEDAFFNPKQIKLLSLVNQFIYVLFSVTSN